MILHDDIERNFDLIETISNIFLIITHYQMILTNISCINQILYTVTRLPIYSNRVGHLVILY